MKVYAIEVAAGEVRARFLARDGSSRQRRRIPVGAFLVDHPRGPVLVDTGLPVPPRMVDRALGRLLAGHWQEPPRFLPEELVAHGLAADDIRTVVLTHLHWDHTGTVNSFARARVVAGAADLEATSHHGKWCRGHAGVVLPPPERIQRVDFQDGPACGPFTHSLDLLGDGSIVLLPTPGHTPGSMTVLAQQSGAPLVLCGDACFLASALARGTGNGTTLGRPQDRDVPQAAITSARLRSLLQHIPDARLIPSHDPDVWDALPRWPEPIGEESNRRQTGLDKAS